MLNCIKQLNCCKLFWAPVLARVNFPFFDVNPFQAGADFEKPLFHEKLTVPAEIS